MAAAVKRNRRYDPYPYGGVTAGDYDGSAARSLQEEVLQPRPVVRPRERAAVRPKVRLREAGAVGFLAVGVFAVLLLFSYVQLMTISQQVADLNSEMTTLQSEEARLRAEYELAYDLDAIGAALTESGTMVEPRNGQVVYVDLSEPDTVTLFRQDDGTPGLEGLFQSVRSIAGEILAYFR